MLPKRKEQPVTVNHAPREIMLLGRAREALAEARTLDEVRTIRDKAEAVRCYARSAKLGLDIQNYAAEVRLRAERKAGVLLRELRLHGGDRKSSSIDRNLKLADLGIDRHESSRWQVTSTLPEKDFNSYVGECTSARRELTAAGVLRISKVQLAKKSAVTKKQRSRGNVVSSLDELKGQTFPCFYVDPPWPYDNQGTRAATSNYYPTMSVDAIARLPVKQLVATNAHLHIWTTSNFLFETIRIMKAWGFDYKSSFVWVKPQFGLGNYWRIAHEFLLLGVKGTLPFEDKTLRSWLEAPRTQHSAKPPEIRDLIERGSPGPYLEMFGRIAIPGWTVFGNQVK